MSLLPDTVYRVKTILNIFFENMSVTSFSVILFCENIVEKKYVENVMLDFFTTFFANIF